MERLSKVGFIGLGNMGYPMAVCLLKAGFTLTVLDVTPEVQQAFVGFTVPTPLPLSVNLVQAAMRLSPCFQMGMR